jgi:hypothetical protein
MKKIIMIIIIFYSCSVFAIDTQNKVCKFDSNNMVVGLNGTKGWVNRYVTGIYVSHYPPAGTTRGKLRASNIEKLNINKLWNDYRVNIYLINHLDVEFSYGKGIMKVYEICYK